MSTSDDVEMTENDSSLMNVQAPNVSMHLGSDRFSRFNIIVNYVFERISSGVSEDQYVNLLRILPGLSKGRAACIMHKRIKTSLFESLSTWMNDAVVDENIKEKFKNLDDLVDESAIYEGQKTWRPNGNVEDHLRSHLMAFKLEKNRSLENTVREKEQRTAMLLQEVSKMRAKVRLLEKKMEQLKEQSLDCSVLDRIDKKIIEKAREFK